MGKLRPNAPTAFGMYLKERRKELAKEGNQFPEGAKGVIDLCLFEFKNFSAEVKESYKQKAKEEKDLKKFDLTKKFTSSGESFAAVRDRQEAEKKARLEFEQLIDSLTIHSKDIPQDERNFIVIKTIHSCVDFNSGDHWPLELSIAAFSMKHGLKCHYSTLVNTKISPSGYANDVMETCRDTALPMPSSEETADFLPIHSNYKKILTSIKKFIEEFLRLYKRDYVLFVVSEKDLKSAEGCLEWLFENSKPSMIEDEIPGWNDFFDHLRFYPLPKLVLKFALIAKSITPEYQNVMALSPDLQQAGEALLNQTTFNYRSDIACDHHAKGDNSYKIDLCCRNIVLRSIYLIASHFVKPWKLEKQDGHDIDKFFEKSKSAQARKNPVPAPTLQKQESKVEQEAMEETSELDNVWSEARSERPRDGVPNPEAAGPLPRSQIFANPVAAAEPAHVFDDAPAPSAGFSVRAPAQSAPSAPRDRPEQISTSPTKAVSGQGQGRGLLLRNDSPVRRNPGFDNAPGPSSPIQDEFGPPTGFSIPNVNPGQGVPGPHPDGPLGPELVRPGRGGGFETVKTGEDFTPGIGRGRGRGITRGRGGFFGH